MSNECENGQKESQRDVGDRGNGDRVYVETVHNFM